MQTNEKKRKRCERYFIRHDLFLKSNEKALPLQQLLLAKLNYSPMCFEQTWLMQREIDLILFFIICNTNNVNKIFRRLRTSKKFQTKFTTIEIHWENFNYIFRF